MNMLKALVPPRLQKMLSSSPHNADMQCFRSVLHHSRSDANICLSSSALRPVVKLAGRKGPLLLFQLNACTERDPARLNQTESTFSLEGRLEVWDVPQRHMQTKSSSNDFQRKIQHIITMCQASKAQNIDMLASESQTPTAPWQTTLRKSQTPDTELAMPCSERSVFGVRIQQTHPCRNARDRTTSYR